MAKWILFLHIALTGCATIKPSPLKVQLPSTSAPREIRQEAYESLRIRGVEDDVLMEGGSADHMSLINKTWYDPEQMQIIFKDCQAKAALREISAGVRARKTAMLVMPLAPVVGAAAGTVFGWLVAAFSGNAFSQGMSPTETGRNTAWGAGIGASVGVLAGVTVGLFQIHLWHLAPKKAAELYNSWLFEQLDLNVSPDGGTTLKLEKKF